MSWPNNEIPAMWVAPDALHADSCTISAVRGLPQHCRRKVLATERMERVGFGRSSVLVYPQ
jgi:hypothetical protein